MGKTTVFICLFVFIGSVTVFSATIEVPGDYLNIADAVDAANDGDVIEVEAGLYEEENIYVYNKTIKIIGEGPLVTTIDGLENGPVIEFVDCTPVIDDPVVFELLIQGFTITNGKAHGSFGDNGGGIYSSNSSPNIKNNIIKNNSAELYGGGIYCTGAETGYRCSPNIIRNRIENNSAGFFGAGICLYDFWDSSQIEYNTITGNSGASKGGGIYILNLQLGARQKILDNYIADHESGGGVYLDKRGKYIVINNEIKNNSGGGLKINTPFLSNETHLIKRNLIYDNEAGNGGGICLLLDGNEVEVLNNLIYQNTATGGKGGGVYVDSPSDIRRVFINNTITENTASNQGGGVYLAYDASQAKFNNEIIYNNTANIGNELYFVQNVPLVPPNVTYSDVEDWQTQGQPWGNDPTNKYVDPLFVAGYHLKSTIPKSQCIDAGTTIGDQAFLTIVFDMDREDRVDTSGYVDMGSDEVH